MEQQEVRALKCPMCDTDFLASDILDGDSIVTCPACARQFSVNDILHKSKEEIVEEMRVKVEESKIELEHEKMRHEFAKEESERQNNDVRDFKKSGFRIVLIFAGIFSAVLCGTAFNDGKIGAGLVTLLMVGCFAVSFLMGINFIPEFRKNFRIVPAIIGFLLFIPATTLYNIDNPNNSSSDYNQDVETITWNNFILGKKLPDFGKTEAEVVWDTDKNLILYFYDIESAKFDSYIEECKQFGYNIDAKDSGANFSAYNENGYYLHLNYYDYDNKNKVTIDLDVPKKKNDIAWPKSNLVNNLPVPDTLIGEVSTESNSSYAIYLVDVEEDYFTEYVSACMENGFNEEYSKSEKYFSAKNKDGIALTIEDKGFNILYIWIRE